MAVRPVDEFHAWDDDPQVYARSMAFERELETVLVPYRDAPQQSPDADVPGIVSAVFKFGVIPGVMIYLVWLMSGGLKADVTDTKNEVKAYVAESRVRDMNMMDRLGRLDRLQERMLAVLFVQCVNGANNQQERNDCARAGQ